MYLIYINRKREMLPFLLYEASITLKLNLSRTLQEKKNASQSPMSTDAKIFNISKLNPEVHKKYNTGASLVAQRLRICLPMQGTRVRALVWEDPTCRGATGPVSHNY